MELSLLKEIMLLLAASVFTISLFRRIHLTPILAYLAAGILVGPSVFGWIQMHDEIHVIAELGIVFLLFSLGLEFSFPKLIAMRKMVFGMGTLQVGITLVLLMMLVMSFGIPWQGAFAIGCILALSSTAIVIKALSEKAIMQTRRGQISVSILLFQDIAVVPMLIAFPLLGGDSDGSLAGALFLALAKGLVVFVVLIGIGKWLLPKIFYEIAQARTDELFVLTTLLVALVAGGVTHLFGLSMALGAFLAGMMLGESQFKHQLESDIRPFRDILMGLFFTTVGMQLDIVAIWQSLHWLVLIVIIVLTIKAVVIFVVGRLLKESKTDALATGIMLSQMGEFGFVLASLALTHELIDAKTTSLLIGVGVVSMGLTPYLVNNASRFANYLIFRKIQKDDHLVEDQATSHLKAHCIICGYGRVGQTVSRFLKSEAIPYVAIDFDPMRVQEARQAGELVNFGDVRKADILKAANISEAKLIAVTINDQTKAVAVVHLVRQLAPDAKVVVRTNNDENLDDLKLAGATEVVPEKLEGSLMLVLHVLFQSGVPIKRIFRRVRRERRNHYNFMHGFFPGENVDINRQNADTLEFLHAIALPDNAFAVGKTLEELNLKRMRVDVIGLRRDHNEIENPALSTLLEAQDVLVIRAKPRRVERAERYLLEG